MKSRSQEIGKYAEEFQKSEPFNHVVIDNFLDGRIADALASRFPGPNEVAWWMYDNPLERKYAFDRVNELDTPFVEVFEYFNSSDFIDQLKSLSGLGSLICDPVLRGGGLHMIGKGGKLDVHEDFNLHKDLRALRKLNLILYLNKDWQEDWGGHLEMWSSDMTRLHRSVLPVHNRAVIFRTDQNSNHGHPHPLDCPEGEFRKSLAVYYYEPVDSIENLEYKSTNYKKLPGEGNDLDELREKRRLGRLEDRIKSEGIS